MHLATNYIYEDEVTIKVSVFDFKQQLLSFLRDKDLMHPSNLVVDKMVSVANGYKIANL